mgnify:CR=1 FL=1|tara:strand:- start:586 stop:780 length:195 start_codon:yes stop_codon:yes gene_type:complete
MTDKYLTPQQLANRWEITRVWLYTLKSKGQVPKFRKRGLGPKARVEFPMSEVLKFEKKHFEVVS